MSVGATTFRLQPSDETLAKNAKGVKAGTEASKALAQGYKAQIEKRVFNLSRTNGLCPTTTDPVIKAYAPKAIKELNEALAVLNKEHNLGTSMKLPAAATATVGLGAAHYMGYLSPVLAKAASYMPAVSMPSISLPSLSLPSLGSVGSAIASVPSFFLGGSKTVATAGFEGCKFVVGTIANATSTVATKAVATASAVDGIWGVSALLPSTTTLAIGTAVVGTALLAAYVAKQCLNKPKQA